MFGSVGPIMHDHFLPLFESNGPNCFPDICDVAQRLFLEDLEQLVLAEVGKTDALKFLIVSLPHSIGAIAQPYAFSQCSHSIIIVIIILFTIIIYEQILLIPI